MSEDLSELVARSAPGDLLPARRAAEAARVQGPLTLLASADLGGSCRYLLVRDERGVSFGVPAVIGTTGMRRAVAGDGAAAALVAGLGHGLTAPLEAEVLGREQWVTGGAAGTEADVPVDQTNDLVIVGGTVMVKWLLHPHAGPQPGAVRARQLIGVEAVPRTWALVHADVDGQRILVATVTDVVLDAEDGWDWAVDDVLRLATDDVEPAVALAAPAALGPLVADLHVALAAHGTGQASADDATAWHARALQDLADAHLADPTASRVRAALAPIAASAGTPVIGVHGDLHIGQVLRTRDTGDLHVIDLEGSPLLTAEENLALQPAARDVSGMLASLDHVGRVVLHHNPDLTTEQRERVHRWMSEARTLFLDGYRASLAARGASELLDERLLHPMLVQQECREYAYARRYLPHWTYVPDAALPPLLEEDRDGS